MKKFRIISSVLMMVLGLCGCASHDPVNVIDKGEPIEFDHFILMETGTMAGYLAYEASCDGDTVVVEKYYANELYDEDKQDYAVYKDVFSSVVGGPELYQKLTEILENVNAVEWDGFNGFDDEVLDGGGFSFSLEKEGNTLVDAEGSNAYPENYSLFKKELEAITSEEN